MSRCYHLVFIFALLAACERPDEASRARVATGRALSGTLAYPRSTAVTVAAGEEAAQLTLTSPDSVQQIVAWYRRALGLNGWVIQKETPGRAGDVSLYAQKGGRPLWITLRPNVGGTGTTYTMIGEIPADSTKR